MSDDGDREFERLVADLTGDPPPPVKPRPVQPVGQPPVQPVGPAPAPTPAPPVQPRRPDGWLERTLHLRVAGILSQRYVDLKLGDLGGTALTVVQAALIGWFLSLAYDGQAEALGLQFVLSMVAVWFGTFNSCREVVKERPLFLRERRAGVSVRAYVLSKLGVLTFLAVVQCLLLVALVARTVRFSAGLPLLYGVLVVTALASTGLGLLLSSLVDNQNKLIALVPLALIPQLIFSDVLLPNPTGLVERIQLLMLADWSLEALRELARAAPSWPTVAGSVAAMLAIGAACLLLAGFALRSAAE